MPRLYVRCPSCTVDATVWSEKRSITCSDCGAEFEYKKGAAAYRLGRITANERSKQFEYMKIVVPVGIFIAIGMALLVWASAQPKAERETSAPSYSSPSRGTGRSSSSSDYSAPNCRKCSGRGCGVCGYDGKANSRRRR